MMVGGGWWLWWLWCLEVADSSMRKDTAAAAAQPAPVKADTPFRPVLLTHSRFSLKGKVFFAMDEYWSKIIQTSHQR